MLKQVYGETLTN